MTTFIPDLFKLAIGQAESGGNPKARGYMHAQMKAPARGKYQITSKTAAALAKLDPDLAEFRGMSGTEILDRIERDPALGEKFQSELMEDQRRTLANIKPGAENDPTAMALIHRWGPSVAKKYLSGDLDQTQPPTQYEKETPQQYLGRFNQHYKESSSMGPEQRMSQGMPYTRGRTGRQGGFTDMASNQRGSDLGQSAMPPAPQNTSQMVTLPDGRRVMTNRPDLMSIPATNLDENAYVRPTPEQLMQMPATNMDATSGGARALGVAPPPQRSPQDEINARIARDSPPQYPSSGGFMGDVRMAERQAPPQFTPDAVDVTQPFMARGMDQMRGQATPPDVAQNFIGQGMQQMRENPYQAAPQAAPQQGLPSPQMRQEMHPDASDYHPEMMGAPRAPLDRSKRQDYLVGQLEARRGRAQEAGKTKKADKMGNKIDRINRRASQGKSSFLERAFGINRESRPYRQEGWADYYDYKKAGREGEKSPEEMLAYKKYLEDNDGPRGAGNAFWIPNEHVMGPRPPANPYTDEMLRPRS